MKSKSRMRTIVKSITIIFKKLFSVNFLFFFLDFFSVLCSAGVTDAIDSVMHKQFLDVLLLLLFNCYFEIDRCDWNPSRILHEFLRGW